MEGRPRRKKNQHCRQNRTGAVQHVRPEEPAQAHAEQGAATTLAATRTASERKMVHAAVRTRPSAVSEISRGDEAIISKVISAIESPNSASSGFANWPAIANRRRR